ncbi:cell wall-binding repeat-containing protein [Euzebya sp.]|uniref:cell wall-binding repeat-containing protein n=1 Tax=Euzebya sp. TaxID=1971409 RepID=UPI003512DC08
MRRGTRAPTTTALLLVGLLCSALPSQATSPGSNGPFLFSSTDTTGIATVGADGTITELTEGSAIHAEISPDGRTVLHTGTTDSRDISIVSLAGGPTQVLVPRGGAGGRPDVSWSPDGSRIAVADGSVLTVYDADGTNPQVLYDAAGDPTFSTDIDAVLWTRLDEIFVLERFREEGVRIDAATGAVTALESPTELRFDTQYGVDSSPDGQQLAITCTDDSADAVVGVCILGRDLGVIRYIPPSVAGVPRIDKPVWSPDGTRTAFVGVDFAADVARLYTATPEGTGVQQVADLPPDSRFQGNVATLQSWARVPDTPPTPLEDPPPPPTNAPLACGGFDGDPATTERADFTDPVAYAVAVSQARFGCDGSDLPNAVVLSRDDNFADSLVGAALTGDRPLLFTQTDTLPSETRTEIDRLLDPGDTVYILGGNAAISDAIEEELDLDYVVARLEGPSRVETSVEVAELAVGTAPARGTDVTTIAIARAGGPADNPTAAWADSVSAGAWTAADAIPTVVTDTASLHPAVADFIEGLDDLERTVLLGGEAALSAAVADAVPNPVRIAGDSRDATAQAIGAELIGDAEDGTRQLVVINGYRADGWTFGLPAAGLAADADAAIALAQDPVPPATLEMACAPADVDLLLAGGLGVLTEAVAAQLDDAPGC